LSGALYLSSCNIYRSESHARSYIVGDGQAIRLSVPADASPHAW
jgi:hypothetical protein